VAKRWHRDDETTIRAFALSADDGPEMMTWLTQS
jgi:hypothetical protein